MGEGSQKLQTPNKDKRKVAMGSQWRYRKQADCLGKLQKREAVGMTQNGRQEGEGAVIVRCSLTSSAWQVSGKRTGISGSAPGASKSAHKSNPIPCLFLKINFIGIQSHSLAYVKSMAASVL